MRSADAIATLEELGSSQWGLVTTGQAESYDISRVTLGRLRDAQIVSQVRRGVWALPSADHGPLQGLRAVWLSTNSSRLAEERLRAAGDVVVSHTSAAAVHRLGDLIPQQHEFTSAKRRQTTQPDLRFHRADVTGDVTIVDGLPVTSIPRTVEDLAGRAVDLDHLASIIRDALASPDVRPQDLADRLDAAAAHHGYADGAALVEESLERAGLPAVAANLSGSEALTRVLAQQSLPAFQSRVLDEMARQIMSSTALDDLARTVGAALFAQIGPSLPIGRSLQQQLHASTQSALAPVMEQNAHALRPVMDRFLQDILSKGQMGPSGDHGARRLEGGGTTPADDSAEEGAVEDDGAEEGGRK